MRTLESWTGRYQRSSAFLIRTISNQSKFLRNKPQSQFLRWKLEEILIDMYRFSRRSIAKLPSKKIRKQKIIF